MVIINYRNKYEKTIKKYGSKKTPRFLIANPPEILRILAIGTLGGVGKKIGEKAFQFIVNQIKERLLKKKQENPEKPDDPYINEIVFNKKEVEKFNDYISKYYLGDEKINKDVLDAINSEGGVLKDRVHCPTQLQLDRLFHLVKEIEIMKKESWFSKIYSNFKRN